MPTDPRSIRDDGRGEITRALSKISAGDPAATHRLWPIVYDELRTIAARLVRMEDPDPLLQPTAIVNEAYLKLVVQAKVRWRDRVHFFAIAAQAMQRLLIDWARTRNRQKRGNGWRRIEFDEHVFVDPGPEEMLAVLSLVEELGKVNERWGRVVQMRFLAGMSVAEVAEALSVSKRTVEGDWQFARAWMHKELDPEG